MFQYKFLLILHTYVYAEILDYIKSKRFYVKLVFDKMKQRVYFKNNFEK